MSRITSLRCPLFTTFAVLPLLIACAASPAKPAASSADNADAATKPAGDEPAKSGTAASSDEGAEKPAATKSEEKAGEKKPTADEDATDKPPTDDSRTTADVAKVFKENRKTFKKCYEDARKKEPELKGHVLLKVVLDGAGKVKKAYVDDESTIHNQQVVDCMIKLAQGLTYPKSSKGLDKDFEYDFGFNTGAQ